MGIICTKSDASRSRADFNAREAAIAKQKAKQAAAPETFHAVETDPPEPKPVQTETEEFIQAYMMMLSHWAEMYKKALHEEFDSGRRNAGGKRSFIVRFRHRFEREFAIAFLDEFLEEKRAKKWSCTKVPRTSHDDTEGSSGWTDVLFTPLDLADAIRNSKILEPAESKPEPEVAAQTQTLQVV